MTTVDLSAYLQGTGYGVIGYGDLRPFIDPARFASNLLGQKPALDANFRGWDPAGTVCVDIVAAGLGSYYTDFQDAVEQDYASNSDTYETDIDNEYFWRRNSTLVTFFENTETFRE